MELFKLFGTIAINGSDEAKRDIEETTDTADNSSERISNAFKKIGTAVATYLAVDKIIDFGKSIVNASAEVSAEISAFEQIMGDYSDNAQLKLNEIADETGVVSSRLTPYMTSLTAKFKGLGYDIDDATSLASNGLLLASDAAAFWDKSLDDAMGGLNSFINGSYEGGEAIGLFANDTQLASYAVQKGIVSETKEWSSLDEARKQATRLQYAQDMYAMSGATGQASKEADQYANVQANLTEKWRQFKSQIGEPILQNIVLPAMQKLSGLVTTLSDSYQKLSTWISKNKETVMIWIGVIGSAVTGLIAYKGAMLAMSIINTVKTWLNGMTIAQKLLNIAMNANPIGVVIALLTSLAVALVYFWNTSEGFRNFVYNLWETVKTAFTNISTTISETWDNIKAKTVEIWSNITQSLSEAWETIQTIVDLGIQFIGELFNLAVDILLIPWNFIWQNFGDVLTEKWELLKITVSDGIESVRSTIETIMNTVYEFFSSKWEAISTFANDVLTQISQYFSEKWNAIYTTVSTIVSNIYNWIYDKFNQARNTISSIFEQVRTTLTNIWNSIYNTISNIINNVKNTIYNVFNTVKNTISGVFNGIWSIASSVWENIYNAIKSPIERARDTVRNVIETIKGFFNFSWSLPKLKLPHLSISGSFNLMPPSVPKFGIEWYKDGGIMTEPTLFGYNPFTNKGMVGGEVEEEAIAPISTLKSYIQESVREENNTIALYIQKLIDMLNDYLEEILSKIDRPIVLDDGTLATKMAPTLDELLGGINRGKGRGR